MFSFLLDNWNDFCKKLCKVHKSFTIWFNAVIGSAMVAFPYAQDQWGMLHGIINDVLYHTVFGVLVIGNILIRFKISKSLADK